MEILCQNETLPTLYKLGAGGKVLVWIGGFDLIGGRMFFMHGTTESLERNTLTVEERDVVVNNSGRSLQEQARLEIKSRWKKKKQQGYRTKLIDETIYTMAAMRPQPWDQTGEKKGSSKLRKKHFPVYIMPKIDGVRCKATTLPGDSEGEYIVDLRTRDAHEINYMTLVREAMLCFRKYLPEVYVLDGELFTFQIEFNELSGICRKAKERNIYELCMKYYIFDLITDQNVKYFKRYDRLLKCYSDFTQDPDAERLGYINVLQIVPAVKVEKFEDIDEIYAIHDHFVKEGYEGIVIRKDEEHVPRKCVKMLKYKTFEDDEAIIVGAEQAKGKDEGSVKWILKKNGVTFSCRPGGTLEQRKEWYRNRKQYIGQKYRYRYQGLAPSGKPRFPTGVGFVYDR